MIKIFWNGPVRRAAGPLNVTPSGPSAGEPESRTRPRVPGDMLTWAQGVRLPRTVSTGTVVR